MAAMEQPGIGEIVFDLARFLSVSISPHWGNLLNRN
jgi:hypothetical protein